MNKIKEKDFNGYSFGDKKMRQYMKFIVISDGDLDLNNAYAFTSETEVKKHLKYKKEVLSLQDIEAVFSVKDVTKKFLK